MQGLRKRKTTELHSLVTRGVPPRMQRQGLVCPQVPGGIPQGGLSEFCGPAGGGKTELLLFFLQAHPQMRVAWIEAELSIYPRVFDLFGVALERIFFVEAADELEWSVLQCIRSQLFPLLVVQDEKRELQGRSLRRLQLAAEMAGVTLILLRSKASRSNWAIRLQVTVRHSVKGNLQVKILKQRGNQKGEA